MRVLSRNYELLLPNASLDKARIEVRLRSALGVR
jgi:hypothetical protein